MKLEKSIIADNIQYYREKLDWHSVIVEMERLFTIDRDPHIRVRIGDAQRKLNGNGKAINEYIFAADLFAERGFTAKALAQYNLALKLDSSNEYARAKMEVMRGKTYLTQRKSKTVKYCMPQPA